MALPNPSMSFSPFAILTAEEMNDLVENIEALAIGAGLTRTTDANGWQVSDYGAWRQYRKRFSYATGSISSGAAYQYVTNGALPVGISSIGTRTLSTGFVASGAAFNNAKSEVGLLPAVTAINLFVLNTDTTTRNWTGYMDITISD